MLCFLMFFLVFFQFKAFVLILIKLSLKKMYKFLLQNSTSVNTV